ncbi:MAG: hypothetical protein ACJKTH_00260 [Patescibacteria group bacterium UBA2163]
MTIDNPERIPEPGSMPIENFIEWHIVENLDHIALALILAAAGVSGYLMARRNFRE